MLVDCLWQDEVSCLTPSLIALTVKKAEYSV